MKFALIRDVITRTTTTTPGGTTDMVTRRIVLGIDPEGAEPIETGRERVRRFVPTTLVIRAMDGGVWFTVQGPSIRKDGTPGTRLEAADFYRNGTRRIFTHRPDAPAEIVQEVQRWV